MLRISQVSLFAIKKKPCKSIKPDKNADMVELEKAEYMAGFEDEDMVLKNYA